jgi:hypothetical protein
MLRNLLENGLLGELKALKTTSDRVESPIEIGLAAVLALVGAVLTDWGDDESGKSKEVPYWDQGGTNDWHYRQWDFVD